jgi:TonB-linked SusC/RagA family outer membrane protein
MRKLRRLIAVVIAAALAPVALVAQDAATITGRVTNAQGQPEAAVLVRIEALNVGASSGADGTYRLVIPGARIRAGQTVQITASRTGLAAQTRTVTLSPGANLTQNFQMGTAVIQLEDLVVTGVAGPTQRQNVPFAVGQVRAEDVPVPPASAAGAIQGRVAGATVTTGTGRPGAAPTVLLRGPTSIDARGRSQEPLYIVDGVILSASVVDIDALDIESVEVVKGAAGASLYGSRAAAGVVNIRTRRGSTVGTDQVRYTVRSEVGRSELGNQPDALFSTRHQFRVDPVSGQFVTAVNADGTLVTCPVMSCPGSPMLAGQRAAGGTATQWNSFMVEEYPGPIYNQVDRFFQNGIYQQHYFSAEGRSGATNYNASYSNHMDEGVMPGNQGFTRHNFRVNLDQAVRTNLMVSTGAMYSRSHQSAFPESSGNPMFALTRVPAGVDLYACQHDVTRSCLNRPDSLRLQTDVFSMESINPLYQLFMREFDAYRGRFLGSTSLRYQFTNWLDLDASVSYDRLDYRQQDYFPHGYRNLGGETARVEDPTVLLPGELGSLSRFHSITEALNGSVTATANWAFRDLFTNRTQFRYLGESLDYTQTNTAGSQFRVGDVPTFDNIPSDRIGASSLRQPVRSDGYFAITNFNVRNRYILDALIRNDGSSLFGADERRQYYYRVAGAWRLSEEPWFPRAVNNFRLHYSYGTAGGRPSFDAQYETYTVTASGIQPINLGNTNLRPEFTREQEAGVDLSILDGRLSLAVTHADSRTTEQILRVPLPAVTGFLGQWRNAGTLESNTWEAALDARLIDRGRFSWTARVLYDRTRQEITQLDVPAFTYGFPNNQGLEQLFYAREGEALGTFYGTRLAQSYADLPQSVRDVAAESEFAVNRLGLLVWVGPNGSLTAPQWGTEAPWFISGRPGRWGAPLRGQCEDRITGDPTFYCPLGSSMPDYKMSFSSNLSFGGLTLYGLIDSWQGFEVYNQPLLWAVFKNLGRIQDQTGVPDNLQHPVGYYNELYNVGQLNPNTEFVEDGSFVKLRELSARYRIGAGTLAGVPLASNLSGVTLSLSGRNLMTWTNYRGYDPEVGFGGSFTGSSALARVEGYQYPPFRTWTLGVELNF